jgi:hypothetical protein
MSINNVTIPAVPVVYPVLLDFIASSVSSLQQFASGACLLDSGDNFINDTEVLVNSTSLQVLQMSSVGSVVNVSYLNNVPGVRASKLRVFYYNPANNERVPLIDFVFEEEVSTPSWGLYSFVFSINFSIV